MTEVKSIVIKGARENNLKNIDVEIPRNKFVVVTGLSGSGKSSLAFQTIYAEGQRRYVQSLSSYARQFLGRMSKPDVDFIRGIPPAIALEQKVNTRNARSTVGTSTEIYEYLRLLYARIGRTYSPVSGIEVKKETYRDVVNYIKTFKEGTRFYICSEIFLPQGRDMYAHLEILLGQGFARIFINDKLYKIQDALEEFLDKKIPENILLVIDRLAIKNDISFEDRVIDSLETAYYEGKDSSVVKIVDGDKFIDRVFSNKFEADGITFQEPTDQMFSFNSPVGACPKCEGYGMVVGIDENLVIPNKNLSIYDDAIFCWRGPKMGKWKDLLVENASKFDFPIFKPWRELTKEQKKLVWKGNKFFHGLDEFFEKLEEKKYKIQFRVMLARYRGKTLCPACEGKRLKEEASYVKINGKAITDLVDISIKELKIFFDNLELSDEEKIISKRLFLEINNRIDFLINVGLGYLTLNRLSSTLSGGESQRINLATSLGSNLVGAIYILDEPSIGLHPVDTQRLINVLLYLRDLGNTVLVVEHDEEIMRAADYLIDIGPGAGRNGGNVVFSGDVKTIMNGKADAKNSYTVKYLTGKEKIEIPQIRRRWNNYIEVLGASENNLKGLNVKFPLNVMTVVTGVSGSGKSSLVTDVFYKLMKKFLDGGVDQTVGNNLIGGDLSMIKDIEMVDQNPIGRSSRSNAITYLKIFDDIRKLFADQKISVIRGYKPSHFSFNVPGGRCETCQGDGVITVPMQFMSDLVYTCEECDGKRYKDEILEVKYRDKNIYDVLNMTVSQAIEFFSEDKDVLARKIVKRLDHLMRVGLGYIKLGQSSSTLSGGENQRVKLAFFLSQENSEKTLFIFDEPSTGLHFHDINILMRSINDLIDRGHTVIIIEHNPDIIKLADHIIDLGPEGGEAGGNVVFQGTYENLLKCNESLTGMYLKQEE